MSCPDDCKKCDQIDVNNPVFECPENPGTYCIMHTHQHPPGLWDEGYRFEEDSGSQNNDPPGSTRRKTLTEDSQSSSIFS